MPPTVQRKQALATRIGYETDHVVRPPRDPPFEGRTPLVFSNGVADEGETLKHWRKPLDSDKYSSPRGRVHLIPDRCKGCAYCIEFCPKEVLEVSDEFNKKGYHIPRVKPGVTCVACMLCERICPDFAIFIEKLDDDAKASKPKGRKGAKT